MISCGYHAKMTFECWDGYLHDRDYDYIDPENIDFPCPKCNRLEFFVQEKSFIENEECTDEYNPWEYLIDWYTKKFNVTKEELYQFFKENEELNVITLYRTDGKESVYNYSEVIVHVSDPTFSGNESTRSQGITVKV